MDCKCKVCGKQFEYGDKNSPCLVDKKWMEIVDFYNLRDYEKKASLLHSIKLNEWEELNDYNWEKLSSFEDKDEYHLYICSDCMEKALGRKIIPSDLYEAEGKKMGMWHYNFEFEKYYFK